MKDDPELWRLRYKEDIMAGLQNGRVFVSCSAEGEIVAGAVCYGPGQSPPERAVAKEWQDRLDKVPPQQRAFLAKVRHEACLCHALELKLACSTMSFSKRSTTSFFLPTLSETTCSCGNLQSLCLISVKDWGDR